MNIKEINNKMDAAISFFEKELSSLRTSRANPSMVENILVDAYGVKTPLSQLGNITVPESTLLTIQIWDTNLLNSIEKSISDSNLGITPQIDGNLIRLPIPKLSEERRNELAKVVSQYGEQSKIAIRNNRREFMDKAKKDEKENNLSQDELKKIMNDIQKITDEYINKVDKLVLIKQEEILKV
ncbi:MAG: Ribosome-recycling factor [Alphaproteobacteria bacterium MarineAlpha5_Bin9]|nr:MAG: Ribosome-recycling factor [Alphaproteobacteria bacterium MarineAlpha5_Bin9]|tara:strand:- start:21002 stop:21550 length:549 start_codon:yes stop_codon:yes gene_type:complete